MLGSNDVLMSFLLSYWGKDEMEYFIENKIVYANFDNCYKFEVLNVNSQEIAGSSQQR